LAIRTFVLKEQVLPLFNFPWAIPVARDRATCLTQSPGGKPGAARHKQRTNDNTMKKTHHIRLRFTNYGGTGRTRCPQPSVARQIALNNPIFAINETIAIAHTFSGTREDPIYHGECGGSNLAAERALRKLAAKLGVKLRDLHIRYEAGPTGFVLARRLRQLKADCVVMSPSKTERKPNEKVKTDKRDAKNIAKLFRNGDITEGRVPPALDEAVRDVCRARTDANVGSVLRLER